MTESTQRRCSTAPLNSLANAVGCQSRTCWSKVEPRRRCWTPVRDGDVLVLGAEGRGAIAAGLTGSTVNSVIEQSAVPVGVVRRCRAPFTMAALRPEGCPDTVLMQRSRPTDVLRGRSCVIQTRCSGHW